MTAAGDLKWRVQFDKPASVDDPYGGTKNNKWTEQFSRAAEITPLKGGEPVMAQRLTGTQPVMLKVRFDSLTRTIASDWRAVEMLNGLPVRYYAIKSPPEDMERKREFITMMAVVGDPDGGNAP
jgi:SPP1 family predicted phage head-tail adaptor